MIRKAISVFLLLIILSGFTAPLVSATTNQTAREVQCSLESQKLSTGLGHFITSNLLWGAAFMGVDMAISLIETLTVFGFKIGGMIEPVDQAVNFIRNMWMEALIWGVVASFFNWFAGNLIETAIELNYILTIENPLIDYGGALILQIANLGLVISIIFIGIATILRLEKDKFSADKLLFKLIVGIVLVNLTIPIALFITNVGTRVTEVMYKSSAPCPVNITRQFTAWELKDRFFTLLTGSPQGPKLEANPEETIALRVDELDDIGGGPPAERAENNEALPPTTGLSAADQRRVEEQRRRMGEQSSAFRGMLSWLANDFLSLLAGSALSFVSALTFLAFGIFLIIRYVVLMLLIVFSPLIWLGFIFSDLKIEGLGSIWSGWWSQFLKWTFFGPVIVLFISFTSTYLAHSAGAERGGGFIVIAELLAILIISAIGLYAAYKFSGAAGGFVMKGVSGGLGLVANKAQGVLKKAQIGAQMRAEEEKLKGNKGKAKAFEILSKTHQATGAGFGLNNYSPLLEQAGIKPTIKAPDEKQIRKDILEKKAKKLKHGKARTGIGASIGVGRQPSVWGIPVGDEKEGYKVGYKKDPKQALYFSEDDVKGLSDNGKKAFVTAVRELQKISSSLNPKELSALRKHEKRFSPELSEAIMKDLKIPPTLASGSTMSTNELNEAKNILQLPNDGVSEILKSGNSDTIENGIKNVLALENELKENPSSFNREELIKLKNIRKGFDEKMTDYILDNLNPLVNPKSILDLSSKNLSQISKEGTAMDKNKIEESIFELMKNSHVLTQQQATDWQRIDAKVIVHKQKNEWL